VTRGDRLWAVSRRRRSRSPMVARRRSSCVDPAAVVRLRQAPPSGVVSRWCATGSTRRVPPTQLGSSPLRAGETAGGALPTETDRSLDRRVKAPMDTGVVDAPLPASPDSLLSGGRNATTPVLSPRGSSGSHRASQSHATGHSQGDGGTATPTEVATAPRREGDSNPRGDFHRQHAFQACALGQTMRSLPLAESVGGRWMGPSMQR
jgi:hypothetical protein